MWWDIIFYPRVDYNTCSIGIYNHITMEKCIEFNFSERLSATCVNLSFLSSGQKTSVRLSKIYRIQLTYT